MSDLQTLSLIMENRRAGILTYHQGRLVLTYDVRHLGREGSTPLSSALPLAAFPHRSRAVAQIISYHLPASAALREAWAARLHLEDAGPLSLLARLGSEGPGAAQFCAPDDVTDLLLSTGELEPVAADDAAGLLISAAAGNPLWSRSEPTWTLGGSRPKALLTRLPSGWAWPSGNQPSSHILRPAFTRTDPGPLAEHVLLRAAASLGISAAPSEYTEFAGIGATITARYDRLEQGGEWLRVHQEPLAAAAAEVLSPRKTHLSALTQVGALLRDRLVPASVTTDLQRFLDALFVGYYAGAAGETWSSHALILLQDRARLAPLHSLDSAFARDPQSLPPQIRLRLPLAGAQYLGALTTKHVYNLAGTLGIRPDQAVDRARILAQHFPDAVSTEIARLGQISGAQFLATNLLGQVGAICQVALAGLAEKSPTAVVPPASVSAPKETVPAEPEPRPDFTPPIDTETATDIEPAAAKQPAPRPMPLPNLRSLGQTAPSTDAMPASPTAVGAALDALSRTRPTSDPLSRLLAAADEIDEAVITREQS